MLKSILTILHDFEAVRERRNNLIWLFIFETIPMNSHSIGIGWEIKKLTFENGTTEQNICDTEHKVHLLIKYHINCKIKYGMFALRTLYEKLLHLIVSLQ